MRCLICLLLTCAAFGLNAASNVLTAGQVERSKTADSYFDVCFQEVRNLTNENPRVLVKLDSFLDTLDSTYRAGEGLIQEDVNRIIDAILFAAKKHEFQVRKDPLQTPYIIHPVGVANSLMTIGKVRDADIIIAALLHDTVEDTDTSFEEIDEAFGAQVVDFVREVTDDKSLSKNVRKQLQIEHASHKSAGAAQIKLGDKLYNLTDLATSPPLDWEQERIDAYFHWAKAVVDNLPWVNAPLKAAVDAVVLDYWNKQIDFERCQK